MGTQLEEGRKRDERKDAVSEGVVAIGIWLSIGIDSKWVDFECPWDAEECQQLCFESRFLFRPSITDLNRS